VIRPPRLTEAVWPRFCFARPTTGCTDLLASTAGQQQAHATFVQFFPRAAVSQRTRQPSPDGCSLPLARTPQDRRASTLPLTEVYSPTSTPSGEVLHQVLCPRRDLTCGFVPNLPSGNLGTTRFAMATTPTTKKLYQHICQGGCCPPRWSEHPSAEEEVRGLNEKTARVPIIHRLCFQDMTWKTRDFTVQEPAMRSLLLKALAGYQDLDPAAARWCFAPPYKPLLHRWDPLQTACDEVIQGGQPGAEAEAARALKVFLKPILASGLDSLERVRRIGRVAWADAWQVLQPGELAVSTMYGVEIVGRIIASEESTVRNPQTGAIDKAWRVILEFVDWNGECSGYRSTQAHIFLYDGYRPVLSLPVFPLSFHEDGDGLRSRLLVRGRKFEKLRGYNFQQYTGFKVTLGRDPQEKMV